MSVIRQIESELQELRAGATGGAQMRTSVMTHVAWLPEEWVDAAEQTLAGLAERHPSRTILLMAEPDAEDGIDAEVAVRCFPRGADAGVCSEVVRLRLRGNRTRAPASLVVPLLISDLPVFCRWRGRPDFVSEPFRQLVGVCDRLVVDSAEWPDVPEAYGPLAGLFDRLAVSDIAWTRTRGWRERIAELWPGIRELERLDVTGPRADALLLAGWLRSRLSRDVALEWRPAEALESIAVDGAPVAAPRGDPPTASDLLSEQLDLFVRDPVYEAAVAASGGPVRGR